MGISSTPYVALQRCRVHIDVTVRPLLSTPTLQAYCKPETRENKNRNHASAHASNLEHVSRHIYSFTQYRNITERIEFFLEIHTHSLLVNISDWWSDKRGEGPLRAAWLKIVFWASGTEGNNLMWDPSDTSEIPLKYTLISFQLSALIREDHQSRIIRKENYMLQIIIFLINGLCRNTPGHWLSIGRMTFEAQFSYATFCIKCCRLPSQLRLQHHHDQTLIKSEKKLLP